MRMIIFPSSISLVGNVSVRSASRKKARGRYHLSLTGASGKVGLYYDAAGKQWYLPKGTAPSTHIVKQSHVRLDGIVTNEQLSMMTAAKCGIDVPESFIIDLGNGDDKEVLYATRRYDRIFDGAVDTIEGLPRPLRLHQEDFSQALGISSANKYEKGHEGYMRMMFDLLRQYSANPIEDQQKLWDRIVFCYLLGNTDAHIRIFPFCTEKTFAVYGLPRHMILSAQPFTRAVRGKCLFLSGMSF